MSDRKYSVCGDVEKQCLIAAYCYMKECVGIDYGQVEIHEFESKISVGIFFDNDLLMYGGYSLGRTLSTDEGFYLTNDEQEQR